MKLSKVAIGFLRGSGIEVKERLAEALNKDIKTIYRYILNNDDNLTKAASLEVIREETGLSDSEILTKELEASGEQN